MNTLLKEIQKCQFCKWLPLWPRPIVSFSPSAKILIIWQAPGIKVHESGIPWDDASGKRLREWLDIDTDIFYDNSRIAIMPMAFCYPGRWKSGDLPPRAECAPKWHTQVLNSMPNLELIILIWWYAQKHYLWNTLEKNLTETVKNYTAYLPRYFVLPHPSPRNNIWMKKNPWFEKLVLPNLRKEIARYI